MYKPKVLIKDISNELSTWDISEENCNFIYDKNTIKAKLINRKNSNFTSISRNYLKEDTYEVSFGISWSILPSNSQVGVKFIGNEEIEYYIKYIDGFYYLFEKYNGKCIDLFPISYGMILWFKCNFYTDEINLSTNFGNNYTIINKCNNLNKIELYSIASNEQSYISYIGLIENNE